MHERKIYYYITQSNVNQCFFLTLASFDFGEPKFWLAIILVEQKLEANQASPWYLRVSLMHAKIMKDNTFARDFGENDVESSRTKHSLSQTWDMIWF